MIILFDIDYTLFNTTVYKYLIADVFAAKLHNISHEESYSLIEEVYSEVRSFGSFDPQLFAQFLKQRKDIALSEETIEHLWWDQHLIQKAMYPETTSVLHALQKDPHTTLGIFSSGKTEFQLMKIAMFQDVLAKEHIHIAAFKEELVNDIFDQYRNEKVILIDDFITILQQVKNKKHDTVAIWMKRGKFAEKAIMPKGFLPDYIVTDLKQLTEIVDKEKLS